MAQLKDIFYCRECSNVSSTVLCSRCGRDLYDDPIPEGAHDPVNHPSHYTDRVPGIEAIDVTRHFNFNIGNAIKYLWRHGLKGDAKQDLEKAKWYIENEIERLKTYGK